MLWLRAFLFVLVVQATVLVVVPWWIAPLGPQLELEPWRYGGLMPLTAGAVALIWCNYAFVARGRGTAAPYDPPRQLVVTGLYRYVRNPMYVSALLITLGVAIWTGAVIIFAYAAFLAVLYSLFIRLYEEPHLRRTFGDEYDRYRAEVPRWLPRLSAHRTESSN